MGKNKEQSVSAVGSHANWQMTHIRSNELNQRIPVKS